MSIDKFRIIVYFNTRHENSILSYLTDEQGEDAKNCQIRKSNFLTRSKVTSCFAVFCKLLFFT